MDIIIIIFIIPLLTSEQGKQKMNGVGIVSVLVPESSSSPVRFVTGTKSRTAERQT